MVQAVAEYYQGIGLKVGELHREVEDEGEVEAPAVYVSPIKQPGIERRLKHAGLVIKKKNDFDLEKLKQYLTAALTNIPQNERNGPGKIEDHVKLFTIRLNHDMSTRVREQLVDIYDLSVHPLVDALNGRVEVLDGEDDDEEEEEELDGSEIEVEDDEIETTADVQVLESG